MFIDTHCHLNFNAFKKDFEEVIKRTLENDIWMINIGSQYRTSQKAVEISQKYENGVFAAVGLHPIHLQEQKVDPEEISGQVGFKTKVEEFDYERYRELAKSKKVVAIGETGLDYWRKPKTKKKLRDFKEKQRRVFLQQLNLAKELNFPMILHCRLAHDDLIEILKKELGNKKLRGVIHCFTGDWKQAKKFLYFDFYFGFNGLIFKKIPGAPDWQEVVKKLPLGKILLETDSPYLTPPPFAEKRNEPLYLPYIAQKIAEIKNEKFEKIAEVTTQNAKNLFKI